MKKKHVFLLAISLLAAFMLCSCGTKQEPDMLGYTPDSLLGSWEEKFAGRGHITISKNAEGEYEIQVNWSSSASETSVWTMTAQPAASNMLRYEKCRHVILTLSEEGPETEKLQYENGTGTFTLLSTNELQWQDETGHAADDALFISVD